MHRRGFLRVLGGVGTAIAVAGCTTTDDEGTAGGDDGGSTTTTGGTATGTTATRTTTGTTAADGTATPTRTGTTATTDPGTTAGTPDGSVPRVSTRDRYAVESGTVVEEDFDSLYDVEGSLPGYSSGTAAPDDLVVLVHGVGMTVEGANEWFAD